MTTALTIGQVAKLAVVSSDTIRLYERYGLIEEPPRAENGYRQYTLDTVEQLRFIQRLKQMGFTLNEIQELLLIHHTTKQSCGAVRQKAKEKLQHITERIHELKQLENALKNLVCACERRQPVESCHIFISVKQTKNK